MLAAVAAAVFGSAASIAAGWPSPLEATAEQIMEWTPVPLANLLLTHLGGFSRPAALLGALAAAMLTGGVAGALGALTVSVAGRRAAGLTVAGALVIAVFLWLVSPTAAAPELPFLAAFLLVLALLSSPPVYRAGRREFLVRSSAVLGGAAVLLALFSARPLLRVLAPRRLFTYARPSGLPVEGLSDLVTPAQSFYRMDRVLQPPEVGTSAWRLVVDGAVERPLTLDYPALLSRRRVDRYVTMECVDNPVGGPMIGTALWTGIGLADLLREAGVRGDTVVFHGADGYTESASYRQIEAAGAVVAYAMNGETLLREHGSPARILLPGVYGFKSVKWLTRIELRPQPYPGDWHSHGWTVAGQIHTTTRIDVARRSDAEILLAGVAFAGSRGVRAVEVRVNGGPWRQATLGKALSRSSWVQWAVRLQGRGPARIEVRSVDGLGQVQSERRHDSFPDGATGWASLTV